MTHGLSAQLFRQISITGWWLTRVAPNNSGCTTNNGGYIWLYDGIYIYILVGG
jgi:hypothetical protein